MITIVQVCSSDVQCNFAQNSHPSPIRARVLIYAGGREERDGTTCEENTWAKSLGREPLQIRSANHDQHGQTKEQEHLLFAAWKPGPNRKQMDGTQPQPLSIKYLKLAPYWNDLFLVVWDFRCKPGTLRPPEKKSRPTLQHGTHRQHTVQPRKRIGSLCCDVDPWICRHAKVESLRSIWYNTADLQIL